MHDMAEVCFLGRILVLGSVMSGLFAGTVAALNQPQSQVLAYSRLKVDLLRLYLFAGNDEAEADQAVDAESSDSEQNEEVHSTETAVPVPAEENNSDDGSVTPIAQ